MGRSVTQIIGDSHDCMKMALEIIAALRDSLVDIHNVAGTSCTNTVISINQFISECQKIINDCEEYLDQ